MELDDLDLMNATTPPTPTGAGPRPHRHHWVLASLKYGADYVPAEHAWRVCLGCDAELDPTAVRRGRKARRDGTVQETVVATLYMGDAVGGAGGQIDVRTPLLAIQSKVGWGQVRWGAELDALPRTGGRVPTLVVTDRQGREYSIRDAKDDADLLGSLLP